MAVNATDTPSRARSKSSISAQEAAERARTRLGLPAVLAGEPAEWSWWLNEARRRWEALDAPYGLGLTLFHLSSAAARVAGLVYLAALAPDADETSPSQQAPFPVMDVFSHIEIADGRVWMLPEGVECFATDQVSDGLLVGRR